MIISVIESNYNISAVPWTCLIICVCSSKHWKVNYLENAVCENAVYVWYKR